MPSPAADPFVHLQVASGYSLRHGASMPDDLVARAVAHDMDTLALTDRDGLFGAIRFAKACRSTGVAPVLGVDLRLGTPSHDHRTRQPEGPRVVVLARGRNGWSALCRLVSLAHTVRGCPVITSEQLIARTAEANGDLVTLVGADSDVGDAVATGDRLGAERRLIHWQERLGESLRVAVTNHQLPGSGPGSLGHAARMLALADHCGVTAVLTNRVRMAEPHLGPTCDVLDCARRLVPLDRRHVDRRNAEAHLKAGKQMLEVAELVARRGGRDHHGAERLLHDTRMLAVQCRLDPVDDIGLGEIHLPELDVLRARLGADTTTGDADAELRHRCEVGLHERWGSIPDDARTRLDHELDVIAHLGFATFFLTVGGIVDLIRGMGIRCAARGSGAGALVNFALGVSGVDPMRHDLVFERFLSPLRRSLPDIDLDVESARREEVYHRILDTFGDDRVACVAMLETYRVRHAVRDVGAALSLPPGEIDAIAKAFPHIRARDARTAIRDLPELRAAGLGERRLDLLLDLVETLDGLPRHVALHPCGIILSDATLRDRTPVEPSAAGFPMSQFDKDDVEDIGLLKLDVLGIRMQSAMAHAVAEIGRTTGELVDLDADTTHLDAATYDLIGRAETVGCFQIESPGQRELVGKFGPSSFGDIIIDISLFRPGPVKSDMVRPFLEARQGWARPRFPHPDLEPILAETAGVVVFHEQVIQIIAAMTGCTLAQADEARRGLGHPDARADLERWFRRRAARYGAAVVDEVWAVLEAFASFGFCKAHAAAFALPTYQSAWLKAHHPAHFLAGVLTHDPGMYPKRLLLAEARRCGVRVLGPDVNVSTDTYTVESVADTGVEQRWGIRIPLAEVKGITEAEVAAIVAARPFRSLVDFHTRTRVSEPVTERLILVGAFDAVHGIARHGTTPGRTTRRDLLLALQDASRASRAGRLADRSRRARGLTRVGVGAGVQAPLDLSDVEDLATGLPELTDAERVRAELDVLGLDVSRHIVGFYDEFLDALGVIRSQELLRVRHREGVLVAGVKVATQTPPVRSGKRVVFCSLEDPTGPVDATFFSDAQARSVPTLFDSWLLLVRGDIRRTGDRGVSVRAEICWDLPELHDLWRRTRSETGDADAALAAVRQALATPRTDHGPDTHRVRQHASGFTMSVYSDVRPAGTPADRAPRKLWHTSPGSPGR